MIRKMTTDEATDPLWYRCEPLSNLSLDLSKFLVLNECHGVAWRLLTCQQSHYIKQVFGGVRFTLSQVYMYPHEWTQV